MQVTKGVWYMRNSVYQALFPPPPPHESSGTRLLSQVWLTLRWTNLATLTILSGNPVVQHKHRQSDDTDLVHVSVLLHMQRQ